MCNSVATGPGCVISNEQGGKSAVEFSTSLNAPTVIQRTRSGLATHAHTQMHTETPNGMRPLTPILPDSN